MILTHPVTDREINAQATEWLAGCAYFRCPHSGLEWLDPLPAGGAVYPDFSAYATQLLTTATAELIREGMPPYEKAAFDWITRQYQPGAKIVEMFAETGRLAWLLRSAGYQVYLADPVANHVNALRQFGFSAVQTARVDDLPAEWHDADAFIVLESLVRLPKPGRFMASVRAHFPKAAVYLTAPSIRRPMKIPGVDRRTGYPPDFLTRWTVPALNFLLEQNGYVARGHMITPDELSRSHKYRWRGRFFLWLQISLMIAAGEYEFSVATTGHLEASNT